VVLGRFVRQCLSILPHEHRLTRRTDSIYKLLQIRILYSTIYGRLSRRLHPCATHRPLVRTASGEARHAEGVILILHPPRQSAFIGESRGTIQRGHRLFVRRFVVRRSPSSPGQSRYGRATQKTMTGCSDLVYCVAVSQVGDGNHRIDGVPSPSLIRTHCLASRSQGRPGRRCPPRHRSRPRSYAIQRRAGGLRSVVAATQTPVNLPAMI
jgi:hypothetical protein